MNKYIMISFLALNLTTPSLAYDRLNHVDSRNDKDVFSITKNGDIITIQGKNIYKQSNIYNIDNDARKLNLNPYEVERELRLRNP